MATGADPNKALRTAQQSIDAAQRVVDGQTAIASDGQVVIAEDDTAYAVTISEGAISDINVVTVPGAPTSPVATKASGQASVAFVAPASDGGTPITSYTAVSTPGSFTKTGSGSPLVVTGLTNGVAYTFKVKATNAVGDGPESAASAAVTPP